MKINEDVDIELLKGMREISNFTKRSVSFEIQRIVWRKFLIQLKNELYDDFYLRT
jgi:hypothetical protein